ncbi:5'-AMP-activated protein kinase beta-2 subunit protein [Striga asiatica]|uniref:5'-AMP-activated protein kinase beta-2 subunit protein n=1 Tax=Striga asiatica TaxID=4170 RepID=A0A5A7PM28_STRAF|nr:5'-AMP-activated protein kinase beta-2 subunit protein [Striga asiatica]
MGNASGREEGGGDSPSEADAQVSMADRDGPDGSYHAPGAEYMGQYPPSSPRASQSPLMFRPQMPVVPLQRPDELKIPSISWMKTSSGYEDGNNEKRIPTMITWSYGGNEVFVEGSWDNWKSRKPLQRSGKDFTIMNVLTSGVYQFRFFVDGEWRYSPDQPYDKDDTGNAYNILDLQDYVPEDTGSISGFEPPQSPDSSYSNLELGQEDFAKEPPMAPQHLNSTLLNVASTHMEIRAPYSRPSHVVLNHLYMHKDKSYPSVVALGSTSRYLSKYVTVVLYKAIQR